MKSGESPDWAIEISHKFPPKVGEASLYGVILYTNRHAYIKKLLEDKSYWAGLDEGAGSRWVVFAAVAEPGKVELAKKGSSSYPLVPIWKEPTSNRALIEAFGIKSTRHLPCLVVFAVGPNEEVLSTHVAIENSSESTAYESLLKTFDVVSDALDFMYDHYRRKETRAFEVVNEQLKAHVQWTKWKHAYSVFQWLRSQF